MSAMLDSFPTATAKFSKYAKMKSLFPECVLRQKMSVDGFTSGEIDAFLTNGVPAGPSMCRPVSDNRLSKYAKMKTMLPEEAVRQKMTVDGCSAASVDTFFASEPPSSSAGPITTPVFTTTKATHQPYAKYAKMQKILPEGAVRQRMMTDGVDPAAIDAFFASDLGTGLCCLTIAPRVSASRLAKYATMQKVFPEVVVRQKMTVDGCDAAFIERFLAAASSTAMDISTPKINPRYARYVKMATLFPFDVVQQKMTVDGFSVTEIAFFLAHGPPLHYFHAPGVTKPIPVKQRAKYAKMRTMLAEGAVRQKMCADGWPAGVIDAFFDDTLDSPTTNRHGKGHGHGHGHGRGHNRGKRALEEGEDGYVDTDKRFRALGAGLF